MKDDLDYNINESDENILDDKRPMKQKKIIIILSSIITVLSLIIIVGIILYFTIGQKNNENNEKEIIQEYYIYINISTSENKMIRNSFIRDRENYIEDLGDLNNGKDYEETERNNFDLCIPNNAAKNKSNYKTIVLFLHGGSWIEGDKPDVLELCESYSPFGFMVATMSYTLLNGQYKEYNLFRIIDEITAVLKTLKKTLIEQGYDENKLELIISGGSAGAHLSLLYSYMIKNPPIPIKFVLNVVGPVTLIPDDFLTIKPGLEPLKNIEPEDIDEAKEQNILVHMNGSDTGVKMNNIYLMNFMNIWLGKSYNDSFNEIFSDVDKREINYDSEIYKERMNKAKFGFPINYVTNESIPTLCVYGGEDESIGINHYALLKKAFKKNNNEKSIKLTYFRYSKHNIFSYWSTSDKENYKNALIYYIKNYINSVKGKI